MHPGVRQSWKYVQDPKTMSNSPRNGSEPAKTTGVDDRHINAPRGSSIVEICPGQYVQDPKTVSNSPRNGLEPAKPTGVDDRHINAPRGSSIVKICPGPQNSE